MNKFSVSVLFIFIITTSITCGTESKNQKFADQVLESFYIQSEKYKTKVRPYFKLAKSDENKRKLFNEWVKSLKELTETLNKINTKGVEPSLTKISQKIMETSQTLMNLLMAPIPSLSLDKVGLYAERMGAQQLEFELKLKNMGLEVTITGED